MRQRMGKRQETTPNLFVKRMLKMACNALCYRVLITCYLHMHSIVSDQRNRPIRKSTDDGDECDAERTKKIIMNYDVIMVECRRMKQQQQQKKTRKKPHEHRNDIYILYKKSGKW